METNEQVTETHETKPVVTANGASNGASNGTPDLSLLERAASNGKFVNLPTNKFGDIKREQRERGKREALTELEKKAQTLGYESLDAMFTAQEQRTTNGNGTAKPQQRREPVRETRQLIQEEPMATQTQDRPKPPVNKNDRQAMSRYEREIDRYKRQLDAANRKAKVEERLRREERRERHRIEARSGLEKVAMSHGCSDVDYTVHMLEQKLQGMDPEEVKKLDQDKFFGEFFGDLRTKKPYLFGEVVRPANTGTGVGGASAPRAGQVAQQVATNGQIDARKMNREEYQEHLRKRGLGTAPTAAPIA